MHDPSQALAPFLYLPLVDVHRATMQPHLLVWLLCILHLATATTGCLAPERAALLSFKAGVKDAGHVLSSWRGHDCCGWHGVVCNNRTRRVVSLLLSGSALEGGAGGSRSINSSLLDLPELRNLDLSQNNFTGIRFPEFIGSFKKLSCLDLTETYFIGGAAQLAHLGNLSRLQYLYLGDALSPAAASDRIDNLDWLARLPSLKRLDLSSLNLTIVTNWFRSVNLLPTLEVLNMEECSLQTIPVSSVGINFTSTLIELYLTDNAFNSNIPTWLWNITSLKVLNLNGCGFSGTIPDAIGDQLTSLVILDLRYNSLSGSIPSSIGRLQNLIGLYLHANDFGGVVGEAHLSNLTGLEELWLSWNSVSVSLSQSWIPPFQLREVGLGMCQIGPRFPEWLRFQKGISRLDLFNNRIEGSLPDWFWNFSSQSDISVSLSGNRISGVLPSSLQLTRFTDLNLADNFLGGPLPVSLPSTLESLGLENNSFTGRLPPWPYLVGLSLGNNKVDGGISSLCRSTRLEVLDVSFNNLSGEVPYCLGGALQALTDLNLGNNNLAGKIPSSLRFLTQLTDLQLSQNSLSGEPLPLLQNFTLLAYLDLAHNKFVGSIPPWMGEMQQQLVYLNLRSNLFSGRIPPQLGQLENLQILDLADNNFSGSIPRSLGNLPAMASTSKSLVFILDPIDLHIVTKGQDLDYQRTPDLSKSLDISGNRLTGEIPEEIGGLAGLKNLNLSRNRLTGKIPWRIGGIKLLESLDLSMNDLSGGIPESLSLLTFLSYLNLSYNNLSGRIPTGRQLQTLNDPSIYTGNPNLCGPPVSRSCSRYRAGENGEKENRVERAEWIWVSVSTILGFVMGFWSFCGVFIIKATWRYAYFYLIDRLLFPVVTGCNHLCRVARTIIGMGK